jgi:branched-chain amino acid transport system substrate-binding protein
VRNLLRTPALIGYGVILLWLFIQFSPHPYYQLYFTQRSKIGAEWQDRGIHIATVWPRSSGPTFRMGIDLLLDRINAGTSMLKNRLKVTEYDETEDSSGRGGLSVAHRLVRDKTIVAVLGHYISASAIPASIVYELHGILFLTPGSTDPRLTEHGFLYTFRLTPSDRDIGAAMAKYAKQRGWQRIGIYLARTPGGESLAPRIAERVLSEGLEIAFQESYLPRSDIWEDQQDFRELIATTKQDRADAIMIADQLPRAAKLIYDLRLMGEKQPIVSCDKLDSPRLWDLIRSKETEGGHPVAAADSAANDVYVASAVDPDIRTPAYDRFKEAYVKKYQQEPTFAATQGFEELSLVVQAGEKSLTADPLVAATSLHEYTFQGLFGEYTFTESGDIQCRYVSIKRLWNQVFTTVFSTRPANWDGTCKPSPARVAKAAEEKQ